jgi:hypothetical protein
MSPEQIRAENVDARSDLYSLGALLFELVTGRQLYVGPTPMSVVTQHTEGNLPRIVDVRPDTAVSPGFEAILRKALAREPRDRFSDAEAMRAALKGLRQDRRSTTHDLTPIPAELADKMLSRQDFDRYERRLRLGRVLAPMLTLVAIITLGASLWRYGIATPPNTPLLTREVEPNDHPSQATPIALSTSVEGAIGASPTNDRDLYVFTVAQAGPVRITLSGVPDLNLTLEVLQFDRTPEGERLRRRLFLDDVGVGAGERVEALHLGVGKAYLRVEEKPFCTEPNRPPREKSLVPYVLRVEAMPGGAAIEFEPNDSDSTAQALPLTQAVVAFCGERIDDLEKRTQMRLDSPFSSPDWFRVDAAPGETVLVAVVPPERGALFFLDGAALETWRAKKASSTPRNPAPPPPVPQLVRNAPVLFELKTTSAGTGRFRVTTDGEALPGTAYHLAAATTGENGLTGWLDLARLLHDADRGAARSAFLSQAVGRVGSSPDLPRLKALLAAP